MTNELQALQHQHQAAQQTQAVGHRQEQERLLQQQHIQLQEHQHTFFRLQNELQQDPTPQREHELLMLQQAGHHTQELFMQQQQHLLEQQQQEQLRMQERHWHQEQLILQRIPPQQHQQQPPSTFPLSPQSQVGNPLEGPQYHQHQQHNSNHFFQNHGYHDHHHQQQQYSQGHENYQHGQQRQHQQQQDCSQGDCAEDMDVDDERELQSITSTITNLRQNASPIDIDSVGSWASGRASPRSADDDEPDAIVVLDTNVLISHLNFLQTLIEACGTPFNRKNRAPVGNGQPQIVFVVPWIVVQELDGLKSNSRGHGTEVNLTEKARRAIRYVQDELEKSEDKRKLRGQKINECIEKQSKNDDYILDCCRYFRTAYPDAKKTKVTLFSNDRNLCVKALIHEVRTIAREKINFELETVRSAILGIESVQTSASTYFLDKNGMEEDFAMIDDDHDMGMGMGTAMESTVTTFGTKKVSIIHKNSRGEYRTEVNERELQRIKSSKITQAPDGMDPKLFELANHVLKNLRRYFEFAVPEHLKAYYGSEWKSITDFNATRVKDDDMSWDSKRLTQPIQLLQKHWQIVFADLYGNSERAKDARAHLDKLQSFVKGWERVETFGLGKFYKKDLATFLEDVDAVLVGVMVKPVMRKSSLSTPSSPNWMPNESPDSNVFYDPSSRIRLMKDWKGHCRALRD
ncbi:hypothetical protein BGX28_006147 [Mortierella sp. GBA30]|nr:hypothetical protein BGX28_006147 [Mortierella sp. GBA30]